MYSLRAYTSMGWGKIRRAFLVSFRRKRVAAKLDRRRGACSRCGACCKIMFKCPAYDDSDGNPKCLIYNDRPGVCSLFPLDERDLRERDFVMPGTKCGFYFEDTAPSESDRRESMPERSGPKRAAGRPVDRTRWASGALAFLRLILSKPSPDADGSGKP